jgi:hypothetical protein
MPNNVNPDVAPGDIVDDRDYIEILNELNDERVRRGDGTIGIDTTDNAGKVESIDYNALANGYNSMSGPKPPSYPSVPTKPVGELIRASDLDYLLDAIEEASRICLCDCNYCTCDCNYCTCDCNYGPACHCDCNYGPHCSCDCNYCADTCTCDGHVTCPCQCDY